MIFEDEGDVVVIRSFETGLDGACDAVKPLFGGEVGAALSGENSAVFAIECGCKLNPFNFLGDFVIDVVAREVWGAAKHRHLEAVRIEAGPDIGNPSGIGFHKAGVELKAIHAKSGCELNPLRDGHGFVDAELIHVAFWKRGDTGLVHGGCPVSWMLSRCIQR